MSGSVRRFALRRGFLLAALSLGAALRFYGGYDNPVEQTSDFSTYLQAARSMLDGSLRDMLFQGPRALWYGAGFFLFRGSEYIHILAVNSFLFFPASALSLYLVAGLVMEKTAWRSLPVLLFALWPPFIDAARLAALENFVLLAICPAVWALSTALRNRSPRRAALAGLLFGAGLLMKSLFLPLFPFLVPAFFFSVKRTFPFLAFLPGPGGRNLLAGAAFVLCAALAVAPWQAYSMARLGYFVPISPFGRHIFFCLNQPYGAGNYDYAYKNRTRLIPEIEGKAVQSREYGEIASAYSMAYLLHDPGAKFRLFPENLAAAFDTRNPIRGFVCPYAEKGCSESGGAEHFRYANAIMLFLGVLGLFVHRGGEGETAAWVIRVFWAWGCLATTFLLYGNARYRLALDPLLFVMAARFLDFGVEAGWKRGWLAPLRGLWAALRAVGLVAVSTLCALRRNPKRTLAAVSAILMAFFAWRLAMDRNVAGPWSLVSGSAAVIAEGDLARPHPVVGLAEPRSGLAFRARFKVAVPESGPYRIFAVYASPRESPVDVAINGVPAFSRAMPESFGGAANRFARKREIGLARLAAGENVLDISASPGGGRKDFTIARFSVPLFRPNDPALNRPARPEPLPPDRFAFSAARDGAADAMPGPLSSPAVEGDFTAGTDYVLAFPSASGGEIRGRAEVLLADAVDGPWRPAAATVFPGGESLLAFTPEHDARYMRARVFLEETPWPPRRLLLEEKRRDADFVPEGAEHRGPFIESIVFEPAPDAGDPNAKERHE